MIVSISLSKTYFKPFSFAPRLVSQALLRTFSLDQRFPSSQPNFNMSQQIHKYGTADGWHGIIQEGGEFPPEKDRYHLYIGIPSTPALPLSEPPPSTMHTQLSAPAIQANSPSSPHRTLLPLCPPRKPHPLPQKPSLLPSHLRRTPLPQRRARLALRQHLPRRHPRPSF